MRVSDGWKDYELLDCSDGERLERWGDVVLIRPDPQAIWNTPHKHPLWHGAHARYHRSASGGGSWEFYKQTPETWQIAYRDLRFNLKPMGFKHTGVFPEQACNWDLVRDFIKKSGRSDVKVLNLFAYTGAATVSALAAGAAVVHVDAAKGMVQWAKENAAASGVADRPVRWIVDDCMKFVAREIRRGNRYDVLIMDPPSYGRGPGGEVWKLEEKLYEFLTQCVAVLSDDPIAVLLNSYTTGLSPAVMSYLLNTTVGARFGGRADADEIGLPVTASGLVLPCGSTAVWTQS
ncbi:MAG: class I SAM-dependent methyltransferase [Clostridia bacterium]|nr:class I SAM-dependent methyltransferase [Clostridia bacterium]